MARRSRLVGRPLPCSRRARWRQSPARSWPAPDPRTDARASSAEPRRSAKPTTLSTRTARSSATVTTSPGRTGTARGIDALAVDPHMAGCRKFCSRLARAHHPGMPEPLVDALAVRVERLTRLLGTAFKLRLQRGELGERRIRIRRLSRRSLPSPRPLMYFARNSGSRSGRSPRSERLPRSPRRCGRHARYPAGVPPAQNGRGDPRVTKDPGGRCDPDVPQRHWR